MQCNQKQNSNSKSPRRTLGSSCHPMLMYCGRLIFWRVRNEDENKNGKVQKKQDRQIQSPTFSGKPPCTPARLHTTPARLISLNHTLAFIWVSG